MKGLEISRKFFEEYGKPMLENEFPELMEYIAVGLVGNGSECLGFDDDVSQDHDFEAGFRIFLPGEDVIDSKTEFKLERAYSKLPKEFCGLKRSLVAPVGGSRNGPVRTSDFYISKIGSPDEKLTNEEWLRIPDYALAEAVNGEIFYDGYGEFTIIRSLISRMPEDIRLKRIAGNLLIMSQSGQYNFMRCLKHGESEAAQLSAFEFVNAAMKAIFLLNKRYMPYYKWSFRALKEIDKENKFYSSLSYITNSGIENGEKKYDAIEEIASKVITLLQDGDMTKAICGDLEKHAYSVNDKIKNGNIRNMNIFAGV